jgi:hypothetical protein
MSLQDQMTARQLLFPFIFERKWGVKFINHLFTGHIVSAACRLSKAYHSRPAMRQACGGNHIILRRAILRRVRSAIRFSRKQQGFSLPQHWR